MAGDGNAGSLLPGDREPAEVADLAVTDSGPVIHQPAPEPVIQETTAVAVGEGDLVHDIQPQHPLHLHLDAGLLPGLPHHGVGGVLPRLNDPGDRGPVAVVGAAACFANLPSRWPSPYSFPPWCRFRSRP